MLRARSSWRFRNFWPAVRLHGQNRLPDSGTARRHPSESAADHLEWRCYHRPGRIERLGERGADRTAGAVTRRVTGAGRSVAVGVARLGVVVTGWGAEERRRSAEYSADDAADGGAGAVEDALHPLAGSAYDVAHRRARAPTVVGLLCRRLRRMNNNLTTLVMTDVVVMPRMHIGLLR